VTLKLFQTTYRFPSGPVNGCENWFVLQAPCGVGSPSVFEQSPVFALTSRGELNDSP
jgi:hypothetical protein